MAKPLKIKKVSPGDPAHLAAVHILRRRIKEFYSHWPDPDQAPTSRQLHNTRISGKRLRYTAESLCEFYPDHLALLIDLFKRSQDLLGEIQDCVTQKLMIEEDLKRLRRRNPQSDDIGVLEGIISNYDQRQVLLFTHFRDIWHGIAMKEFRASLKVMTTKSKPPQP
jgi:CHAD domain-containing protein